MTSAITWLEALVGTLPLPLLEVWGRFAYLAGLVLAICAFGGITFRIGDRWGIGRERLAWDARAFLSVPLTSVLIIAAGYLGSVIVLVPGAQTFESLKDLREVRHPRDAPRTVLPFRRRRPRILQARNRGPGRHHRGGSARAVGSTFWFELPAQPWGQTLV